MKPSLPLFALSATVLGGAATFGQGRGKAADVRFGRDIKPILSDHCFKCHGPDASKAAAGLRLDSFEGATKALYDGAAIVPGDPAKSRLLERVAAHDGEIRMPPSDSRMKALTPEEIEKIRTWITQGAKYEKHWSFIPPAMPPIPEVDAIRT